MFRKDLIDLLKHRPATLHQVAASLDAKPRELEQHLEHRLRPLRREPLRPVITPAACRRCGWLHRDTRHRPGKCPCCKGPWIRDPLIGLEARR